MFSVFTLKLTTDRFTSDLIDGFSFRFVERILALAPLLAQGVSVLVCAPSDPLISPLSELIVMTLLSGAQSPPVPLPVMTSRMYLVHYITQGTKVHSTCTPLALHTAFWVC